MTTSDRAGLADKLRITGGDDLESSEAAAAVPMHWSAAGRFWFRVAFLYFFCFIFLYGNGTIFSMIPWVGDHLEIWMDWPTGTLAVWLGVHVFHLTGIAARWHPTGSGDTTLSWIQNGLFVVYAVVGGLVWTAIAMARGSRRREYQTLFAWLRFGLRLTVGFQMLNYGVSKLFPMQMAPISIAILNEPVGNMSPMTFLWALIGMNPAYEVVCGLAEVVGGVLFLFRRTALAGALVSSFVMANVVLYNFFFDVPVKLFATNLLAASLFVILPDAQALFDFFWRHQPAAPAGVWVPPATRKGFRTATRVVEIACLLLFAGYMPFMSGKEWSKARTVERTASPVLGAWHVDQPLKATGFVTPEGLLVTDLYVDTVRRAFTRATDGALWRTELDVEDKSHTLEMGIVGDEGERAKYSFAMPDGNHLVLTNAVPEKGKQGLAFKTVTVSMTRTPVPAKYPLLERGFHFVNQWGLER